MLVSDCKWEDTHSHFLKIFVRRSLVILSICYILDSVLDGFFIYILFVNNKDILVLVIQVKKQRLHDIHLLKIKHLVKW